MKKNVVIGVLALVSAVSILYSFYYKSEANRQREIAIQQQGIAAKNREEAMRQRLIAEEQAKRCEEQIKMLETNGRGSK